MSPKLKLQYETTEYEALDPSGTNSHQSGKVIIPQSRLWLITKVVARKGVDHSGKPVCFSRSPKQRSRKNQPVQALGLLLCAVGLIGGRTISPSACFLGIIAFSCTNPPFVQTSFQIGRINGIIACSLATDILTCRSAMCQLTSALQEVSQVGVGSAYQA